MMRAPHTVRYRIIRLGCALTGIAVVTLLSLLDHRSPSITEMFLGAAVGMLLFENVANEIRIRLLGATVQLLLAVANSTSRFRIGLVDQDGEDTNASDPF